MTPKCVIDCVKIRLAQLYRELSRLRIRIDVYGKDREPDAVLVAQEITDLLSWMENCQ